MNILFIYYILKTSMKTVALVIYLIFSLLRVCFKCIYDIRQESMWMRKT